MNHSRHWLGGIAIALVLFGAQTSRAGDAPSDAQALTAGTHFDRGVKLYEDHDYRTALVEFERAYAIAPVYRVLYNVGQCRYQLEDYAGSLQAFEKYLAEGDVQIAQDRREQVKTTIAELRGRVAHIRILANVEGATVTVDDTVVGTTPLAQPLLVSAGRRRIAVSKGGRASEARIVDLAGEDSVDVPLELDAAPASADAARVSKPKNERSMVPAIVAFGVSAAGVAVGAMFGVEALDNKWALDRSCAGSACPSSSMMLIDDARRNAMISSIGFVVGAAGLGAGLLFVFWPSSVHDSSTTGSAPISPYVGLGSAGAIGRF